MVIVNLHLMNELNVHKKILVITGNPEESQVIPVLRKKTEYTLEILPYNQSQFNRDGFSTDLIIVDIQPDTNGQAISLIESLHQQSDIPVLCIVADPEKTDINALIAAQPDAYLSNPTNIHNLEAGIALAIKSGRTRKQLFACYRQMKVLSDTTLEINNPNHTIMLAGSTLKRVWTDILKIVDEYHQTVKPVELAGLAYPEIREDIQDLITGILDASYKIESIIRDFVHYRVMNDSPDQHHKDDSCQ